MRAISWTIQLEIMICFPNAKINLGLYVTRKRQDEYHDITSCLFPIPLRDVLEIIPSDQFSFQQTGLDIPGNGNKNLCIQAYDLLKQDYKIPPVAIHLHKVIPMGAGLGGGSADCAFTLKLLNDVFSIGLSTAQLEDYAAKLGSDCPFFIKNIPAIATGTGTTLHPLDLDLPNYFVALIFPGVHIGTKEAYGSLSPKKPAFSIEETLRSPVDSWQERLINDFQPAAEKSHVNIGNALHTMKASGALYYAMTGSGSAVFGLFDHRPDDEGFDYVGALGEL